MGPCGPTGTATKPRAAPEVARGCPRQGNRTRRSSHCAKRKDVQFPLGKSVLLRTKQLGLFLANAVGPKAVACTPHHQGLLTLWHGLVQSRPAGGKSGFSTRWRFAFAHGPECAFTSGRTLSLWMDRWHARGRQKITLPLRTARPAACVDLLRPPSRAARPALLVDAVGTVRFANPALRALAPRPRRSISQAPFRAASPRCWPRSSARGGPGPARCPCATARTRAGCGPRFRPWPGPGRPWACSRTPRPSAAPSRPTAAAKPCSPCSTAFPTPCTSPATCRTSTPPSTPSCAT